MMHRAAASSASSLCRRASAPAARRRLLLNSRNKASSPAENFVGHNTTDASSFPPSSPLAMVDPTVLSSYPDGATHLTDAEISLFSDIKPTPVSLRQILETRDAYEAAVFLHSEFPVRCAERIRMIESIPTSSWVNVPELVEAHGRHVLAFWKMRAVTLPEGCEQNEQQQQQQDVVAGRCLPELEEFTQAVREIIQDGADMTQVVTKGMTGLYNTCDEECVDMSYVDNFLNTFLLNRLGSTVLLKQYLAVASSPQEVGVNSNNALNSFGGPSAGIVDPECDVARLCRETAREVTKMCRQETDRSPPAIKVEAFSAAADDQGMATSPKFSFIPPALSYILRELLKNSCHATLDSCEALPRGEIRQRPITVTISADEKRMMICVADRGGGIPFDRIDSVWSYLHSTTRMKSFDVDEMAECDKTHQRPPQLSDPNELAGYGIGLPMSRLYARYLGGDLNLITLPGYGTHAYIFLPRLSSDQIETFPERHEYVGGNGSFGRGDFVL